LVGGSLRCHDPAASAEGISFDVDLADIAVSDRSSAICWYQTDMSSIHRSIFFSAVERYGSLLLLLFSTAVLSRLLTPGEFGIYAVINAVVAVITASFQEFGGANYLIQKKILSEQNIRTAFTITFCISIIIGLALFICSDALVWFFRQDGLKAGIAVSALNFALTPFSVVISALFRRDMEFGKLAICSLAANFVSIAVSIALAILHYSFMAPIWGAVAGNVILTALLIAFCKNKRVFRLSLAEYPDVMRFGLYSGGVSIINVFYNLAPQIFLARILDFAAVGLYSRAVGITQVFDRLVSQVLNPVIMPAIFAQTKAGGNLKRIYLDAIALLTAVHWPFLTFVAIMAHPIILIWLGPTWLEIVPLVRMMCIAYLSLFVACLTYPVLVAVGRVRDALMSSLVSLPPSLLVIFVASFFGVQAVAASALLTLPFQAAVAIYFVSRHLDIGLLDLFRATFKSGIVTLFSCVGVAVCAAMVEYGLLGPILGLLLACISAAICWLLSMVVTEHPLLPRLQLAATGLFDMSLLKFAGYAKRNSIV
jgi:O-antigen/teichoic acid export membrane protein